MTGAEFAWHKFFRVCELIHTVRALPGTNFHAASIVIAM